MKFGSSGGEAAAETKQNKKNLPNWKVLKYLKDKFLQRSRMN